MTAATKTHFLRLVRALKTTMQDSQSEPNELIGSILERWCKDSFPGVPISGLKVNTELMRYPASIEFVEFVKSQDFLEATYWLSSAYAQLAGEERRKQLAMFFTPPSLTKRLLDDLSASGVDFSARKFCDPACGGAAFLVPIAMRIRDSLREQGLLPSQILEHVQEHLLGFDIDDALCELSKHFLLMVMHEEVVEMDNRPEFQIHQCDSLLMAKNLFGRMDVVVCNPPFRKVPLSEVVHYKDTFADIIEAQPNLYALFITLCVKLIAPGGICALVTPTSFLSGRNFSKLRRYLMRQVTMLSIGMVSDRSGVFIDVEQETALTLALHEEVKDLRIKETKISVIARNGNYVDVGRCILPDSGVSWPIPRTENDVALLKSVANSCATLTDYGYVARIGAFVWNRDKRMTYASAKKAEQERNGAAVPLLWSSDIAPNGHLRFTGATKSNQEHCFINMGIKDHRSVVRRPSVLLQRVTSNDQPRRLIAAAVPKTLFDTYGGFVGENHTVILEQVIPEPVLTPEQFAQLLATPIVDRCFRCISGANNVSVFELSQLRLPDPERLKSFLNLGLDMPSAVCKALLEP